MKNPGPSCTLCPTPPWGTNETGRLTHMPRIFDSRQQRFAARLANACSSKPWELHQNPSPGEPICRVDKIEHEHGRTTEGSNRMAPGEHSVLRTTVFDDAATAKTDAQHRTWEKDAKIGAQGWIWRPDGTRADDGLEGATAGCTHGYHWKFWPSCLCTGHTEVIYVEVWVIGFALDVTITQNQTFQRLRVMMVALCSHSQHANWHTAHLEPGWAQRLVIWINLKLQTLFHHGIATEIHWIPSHPIIRRKYKAECHTNLARYWSGHAVREHLYSSASNWARQISERSSAAEVKWEADNCSKHFTYRVKGQKGTHKPIPMRIVKSLVTRFYRVQHGDAPTAV